MKKWIFLLRAFFPSWRFFDIAGPELRLEVRTGATAEALGDWRPVLSPIRRSLRNLIFNPYGNDLHACHNLLSHLNSDIQEFGTEVVERPSYSLARNLVRESARDSRGAYQFRLIAVGVDEILLSPVYAE